MNGLVDTHCHLDLLRGPVPEALVGARSAGVETVITVGTDLPSSVQAVALAHEHVGDGSEAEVLATVGLHPHDAKQWSDELAGELWRLARDSRVVAVGECGLDYYRDLSPRDDQRRAFVGQIELARRIGKPLVVHVREAGEEALDVLARHASDLAVVLHCFSQVEAVEECARRGYYLSFAGNVTYKNAGDLRRAARAVPDDRLLLETDAPFLAPVPYRGKANLPARVVLTAALVGEIRGEDGRMLAQQTTANARRAFALPGR
jgi:TatD DNase family protein